MNSFFNSFHDYFQIKELSTQHYYTLWSSCDRKYLITPIYPMVTIYWLYGYETGVKPAILSLKQISKAGQRIYKSSSKIRPVQGGRGIAIISTSKGIMTDKDTRKQNLGGEVICEIW